MITLSSETVVQNGWKVVRVDVKNNRPKMLP